MDTYYPTRSIAAGRRSICSSRQLRRPRKLQMHVSEKNRLKKRVRWLLLAASDMNQAAAAVAALRDTEDGIERDSLRRALATAIPVCYGRVFTQSNYGAAEEDDKPKGKDLELHGVLMESRNKVYAHTDKESGRYATVYVVEGEPISAESWQMFPAETFEPIIELARKLHDQYRAEAIRLARQLHAAGIDAFGD